MNLLISVLGKIILPLRQDTEDENVQASLYLTDRMLSESSDIDNYLQIKITNRQDFKN